ncbi:MAG: discoidin domain-containing protein [Myxococcota bacterium]
MSVQWSSLHHSAQGDESARAGAIIRGQAELERFLNASGYPRQDGESLYQLLVRARQQAGADWISEDIGWAIQLRNRIAHEGLQPSAADAARAIAAYEDAALKLGWIPSSDDPDPEPSAIPPKRTRAAQTTEPSSPDKTAAKHPAAEHPAAEATRAEEAPAKEKKPKPRRKRTPRKKKKPTPKDAPRSGGSLAMVVVFGGLLAAFWGLSAWTGPRTVAPGLRHWMRPMDAQASSTAPDTSPIAAVDGDPGTAWCEGADGVGNGERLTVRLNTAQPIEGLRLKSGHHASASAFSQHRAPIRLTVIVGSHAVPVRVRPERGVFAEVTLPEPVTTQQVDFVIEEVGPAPFTAACISEVEVRAPVPVAEALAH